VEIKVPHDKVVQMILISVMAFIKYHKVKFLHFEETMHEKIIKLFSHTNEDVMTREFVLPCEVIFKIARLLLSSMVPANNQLSVAINRVSLLFDKILCWNDENSFFPFPIES
jgi:hypothetical protein